MIGFKDVEDAILEDLHEFYQHCISQVTGKEDDHLIWKGLWMIRNRMFELAITECDRLVNDQRPRIEALEAKMQDSAVQTIH